MNVQKYSLAFCTAFGILNKLVALPVVMNSYNEIFTYEGKNVTCIIKRKYYKGNPQIMEQT